jgi:hypothetical protein
MGHGGEREKAYGIRFRAKGRRRFHHRVHGVGSRGTRRRKRKGRRKEEFSTLIT